MRHRILLSILAILTVLNDEANAQHREYSNYCPERDFVEVCLKSATSMEALKEWVDKNDWRLEMDRMLGFRKFAYVTRKNPRVSFVVSEIRFSDTSLFTCRFFTAPFSIIPDRPTCKGQLSKIEQEVGAKGFELKEVSDSGISWWRWRYEQNAWRIFVSASLKGYGKLPNFSLTRIKSAIPLE